MDKLNVDNKQRYCNTFLVFNIFNGNTNSRDVKLLRNIVLFLQNLTAYCNIPKYLSFTISNEL